MTQEILVDTYRHNLFTVVLIQLGIAEYHAWRQLLKKGQQAEDLVTWQKGGDFWTPSPDWPPCKKSKPGTIKQEGDLGSRGKIIDELPTY